MYYIFHHASLSSDMFFGGRKKSVRTYASRLLAYKLVRITSRPFSFIRLCCVKHRVRRSFGLETEPAAVPEADSEHEPNRYLQTHGGSLLT